MMSQDPQTPTPNSHNSPLSSLSQRDQTHPMPSGEQSVSSSCRPKDPQQLETSQQCIQQYQEQPHQCSHLSQGAAHSDMGLQSSTNSIQSENGFHLTTEYAMIASSQQDEEYSLPVPDQLLLSLSAMNINFSSSFYLATAHSSQRGTSTQKTTIEQEESLSWDEPRSRYLQEQTVNVLADIRHRFPTKQFYIFHRLKSPSQYSSSQEDSEDEDTVLMEPVTRRRNTGESWLVEEQMTKMRIGENNTGEIVQKDTMENYGTYQSKLNKMWAIDEGISFEQDQDKEFIRRLLKQICSTKYAE